MLSVLKVPDRRLRFKAKPVRRDDPSIEEVLEGMLETMYHANGIGLAGNQVGILKRIIVIDIRSRCPEIPVLKIINPVLLSKSKELSVYEEGCLSVPGQLADVVRPKKVKIRYQDENFEYKEIEDDEFLATCLQHEMDHLDGKLYIDYLSVEDRNFLIQEAIKYVHQKK